MSRVNPRADCEHPGVPTPRTKLARVAIEREPTGAKRPHHEHAAHDGQILQEIDLLHLVFGRRERPEIVEDNRRRDQEQKDRQRRPARLVSDQQQQTGAQFDCALPSGQIEQQ